VLAERCNELGVESVVQYSCRGRRLVRMQSEMLGAYAAGVRNLLLVTGDPLEPGTDPDHPPDLEIDSIGAVNLASRLNHGLDVGSNPFGKPTGLHIGVRLDPTSHDPEREVSRFRWKVDAGAEFAVTVPIFDPAALQRLLEMIEDVRIPVLATIWPLRSAREAEFFEHELAQVPVPASVIDRMRQAEQRGAEADEGLAIAKETAAATRPMVEGMVVVAPDGDADMALPILDVIG
jgi:homocysteine S-methyltransferase